MLYAAGPGTRVLRKGRREAVALFPATRERKVIVLLHAGGNWLPYSEETERRILALLEKIERALSR